MVFAAGLTAILSMLIGGNSYIALYPALSLGDNSLLMNWWMSDVLGIVLITPLLLLYTPSALFKVVTK